MVLGQRARFTYGQSDYVYSGLVIERVPALVHPLSLGYHVPEREVRQYESYLVKVGSQVFWPENVRYL